MRIRKNAPFSPVQHQTAIVITGDRRHTSHRRANNDSVDRADNTNTKASKGIDHVVIIGNTISRVLPHYSAIVHGKATRPLASQLHKACRQLVTSGTARKCHILLITRHSIASRAAIRSSHTLALLNCLAFLSLPGPSTTSAVTRVRGTNVAIAVLANSRPRITHAITQGINVGTQQIIANQALSSVASATLNARLHHIGIFTGLAPRRGTHVISLLHHRKRYIKCVNSNIGSLPTVRTDRVTVDTDANSRTIQRSTSIVLARGGLSILLHNVARDEHAYIGVVGCVGLTLDSGFNGVVSIVVTNTFLPFIPVTPIRVILLGLVCSLTYLTVP